MRHRTTDEDILYLDGPAEFSEERLHLINKIVLDIVNKDQDTDRIDTGICTKANGALLYNNRCNEKKGKNMANIVEKSELVLKDGYLTHRKGGTVVTPGFVSAYIQLEDFLQHAMYDNKAKVIASLPRFEKESTFDKERIKVPVPKTPRLDKEGRNADKQAAELRLINAYEEVVGVLLHHNAVVELVLSDNIVVFDEDYRATIIDTPMLGNPLELTKEKLLKLVCDAAQYPLG